MLPASFDLNQRGGEAPFRVRIRLFAGGLALWAASPLAGCEDHASRCTGTAPAFSEKVSPILQMCGGSENCHARPTYDTLVNVPSGQCGAGLLVSPGHPDRSYLINKLIGVGMCPDTRQMPYGGSLPDEQIQLIVDWICSGAANN
jgi:hypothetical protein